MYADEDGGHEVADDDCEVGAELLHDDGSEAAGDGGDRVEQGEQDRAQMRLERADTCLQRENRQHRGRAGRVSQQEGHAVTEYRLAGWPRPGRRRPDRRDQSTHRRRARRRVHGVATSPGQRRDAGRPAGDRRVRRHVLRTDRWRKTEAGATFPPSTWRERDSARSVRDACLKTPIKSASRRC